MVLKPFQRKFTREKMMENVKYALMLHDVRREKNKNARIQSRVCRNGKVRTETTRRDEGETKMAMTTDPKSHSSRLFIDFDDGTSLMLTGREARTLYRVLNHHYNESFNETLVQI